MYLENLFSLEGKVAVVTGGGKGIGQIAALGLSQAGARVAIISRSGADETVGLIEAEDGQAMALTVDVTDEAAVDAALEKIMQRFGRIDIVFNNAGICIHKNTVEASLDEWKSVIDVNLTGAYIVARAAGRIMIENGIKGSIINNASMSGSVVNVPQMQASYNASKAGLIHLTRSLAIEWVDHGIRVNTLSPGYIATPISTDTPKELRDAWLPLIPMHRMADASELVGALIYLASDASTYTTGANLIVDGGYSCI